MFLLLICLFLFEGHVRYQLGVELCKLESNHFFLCLFNVVCLFLCYLNMAEVGSTTCGAGGGESASVGECVE
jgi:hypothetical protein